MILGLLVRPPSSPLPAPALVAGAGASLRIFHGTLCVQVRVGGRPLWFVMDSGAAYSTVEPSAVRGLAESVPFEDDGRYVPNHGLLRAKRIDVGGATLLDPIFFAASSPYAPVPGDRPEDRVVGLLGYDALRLLTVGVDFQNRRLWAWRPEQSASGRAYFFGPDRGMALCSMRVGEFGLPTVACRLGGLPVRAVIDTGSATMGLARACGPPRRASDPRAEHP